MRLVSLIGLLCSGLCLSACDEQTAKPTNLPWQVTLNAQHNPEVFHVTVGQNSLRQTIEQLKSFPEMAVLLSRTLTGISGLKALAAMPL